MGRIKRNINKEEKEEFINKTLANPKISEYRKPSQITDHPILAHDLISDHFINLFVRAYVHNYTGYGELARTFLHYLKERNEVSIKLAPIHCIQEIDPIEMTEIDTMRSPRNFSIDDSIFLGITNPAHFGLGEKFLNCGKYKIGWTMSESFNVSKEIIGDLNNLDEVWCPSHADIRRFKESNAKLVHMPYGYDENRYKQHLQPADIANVRGKYVFGFLGSWYERKSIKEIIAAYCQAFSKGDNVSLVLMSKYFGRPYDETLPFADCGYCRKKEELDKWNIEWEFDKILDYVQNLIDKKVEDFPPISIIDVSIHSNIMPNIISRFDCLVGFSKGESLWLPGLQALACGVPVIQLKSGCSGFMDYLENNPYLCRRVKYEAADESLYGHIPMYKGEQFAHGSISELAIMMETVFKDKSVKDVISDLLYDVERYKWCNTLQSVLNRLFEINKT